MTALKQLWSHANPQTPPESDPTPRGMRVVRPEAWSRVSLQRKTAALGPVLRGSLNVPLRAGFIRSPGLGALRDKRRRNGYGAGELP